MCYKLVYTIREYFLVRNDKHLPTMNQKINPTILVSLVILVSLAALNGCSSKKNTENGYAGTYATQPALGFRTAKILEEDGLQFKDLNRNNELDAYEDWRLSFDDRSKDLVSKMSLEQKAGFMIIASTRLKNDWSFEKPKTNDPISSGFNEDDLVMPINMFTKKPLPYPNMSSAGTTKAVTQFHQRHFILRANPSANIIAEWHNNLQALCESDGLGIPAIITSNPRNHITIDASIGLSVGKTSFSTWPGELGRCNERFNAYTRFCKHCQAGMVGRWNP
jgi:beta-glucosidase